MRTLLHIGPFNLPEASRKLLRQGCGEASVVETQDATKLDQFPDTQFDVLVSEEVPRRLEAWPRLKFVQLLSAGINHLKDHPVWETDIVVANASGTHTVPIAQYVTCAVLMVAHRMPHITSRAITQRWARDEFACAVVRGRTVGIIGYGSIGRECGRQLHALGMRIVCSKRNPVERRDTGYTAWRGTGDPEGKIPERWFGPGQLREMLPLCDVVVLTAPATDATMGLIGGPELGWMKPSALLINVARGGLVDEPALAQAVRHGQIAGAVVDCFKTEPIPSDHPFFDVPNMILTPHMSGVFDSFWAVMADLLGENLRRFAAGQPVLNRVNSRLGY